MFECGPESTTSQIVLLLIVHRSINGTCNYVPKRSYPMFPPEFHTSMYSSSSLWSHIQFWVFNFYFTKASSAVNYLSCYTDDGGVEAMLFCLLSSG